jgi:hypothetical protein
MEKNLEELGREHLMTLARWLIAENIEVFESQETKGSFPI